MTDSQAGSGSGSITMFAGKGGVGKTTCAAAAALHYSSLGEQTLAISTDAAPSLAHVFEIASGQKMAWVNGSLCTNEMGAAEVREMWDKKFGGEVYEVFSSFVAVSYAEFTEFMTSLLPGLSEEFMVDYIRELSRQGKYETIVWDTAPLGQTLALLKTPALLSEHLRMAPRIYSKLKLGQGSRKPILDIIKHWARLSADNMEFLRSKVRFTLVTIAEALAVEQMEGVFHELDENGLTIERLVINNVVKEDGSEFLAVKARQQRNYLELIYDKYSNLEIIELPLFPYEPKGPKRLSEVAGILFPRTVNPG